MAKQIEAVRGDEVDREIIVRDTIRIQTDMDVARNVNTAIANHGWVNVAVVATKIDGSLGWSTSFFCSTSSVKRFEQSDFDRFKCDDLEVVDQKLDEACIR